MEAPVLYAFDPGSGIARITFNRPDVLNAIDVPAAVAFADAARQATSEPRVRCIVLSGAGRAFAAGGDVTSFSVEPARVVAELLDALHPALLALRSCAAPVVAVVQGAAAGAGLSIALCADIVLAGERARFLVAYDRIGAPPDCGGTWLLPRKAGRTRAFAMMLLGEPMDARAAMDAGLVTEMVPDADLPRRTEEVAQRIASGPTIAYGAFKRLADAAHATSFADQLDAERAAFLSVTRTADFREGAAAFAAGRAPRFSGS